MAWFEKHTEGGRKMSKENGGYAFPVEKIGHAGMSLRDYFAAKAMQGLMVGVEEPYGDYIARSEEHTSELQSH